MKCTQCGTESLFDGNNFCTQCGAFLSSTPENSKIQFSAGAAWESPCFADAPFTALFQTISDLLLHPKEILLQSARKPNRTRHALLYGLIVGSIGMTASWGWTLLLTGNLSNLPFHEILIDESLKSPLTLIFSPLLLLMKLIFLALYTGGVLKLFHSRKVRFRHTLRMICYAETPMVLQVIPVVGIITALVMWIYTFLTGIHYLYRISRIKLVFLLILPILLLFFLGMLIMAATVAGGMFGTSELLPQLPPIFK